MAACIVLLTFCDVAGNGIPDNTDAYKLHQQAKIQIFFVKLAAVALLSDIDGLCQKQTL